MNEIFFAKKFLQGDLWKLISNFLHTLNLFDPCFSFHFWLRNLSKKKDLEKIFWFFSSIFLDVFNKLKPFRTPNTNNKPTNIKGLTLILIYISKYFGLTLL